MISSYEQEILDEYDREMKMKGMTFLQPPLPILPSHKKAAKSVTPKRRLLEQALNLMPATNYCTEVKRRRTVALITKNSCSDQAPDSPQVSEDAVTKFLKSQSQKKEACRQKIGENAKTTEERSACNHELKACKVTKKVSCESNLDNRIKLLKKKAQVKC